QKEGLEVMLGERFFLLKNGSLHIKTTKFEDTGIYDCVAENSMGTSRNYANLYVKDPTKIVIPPQDMNIKRGSMAKLQCKAQYDQSFTDELKIVWQKDGKEIDSNNEDSRYSTDEGILHIINVSHTDKGLYTCIVRTSLDQDTATAYITVL
ncbi:neural cell adhesion molecule L1-like protein isoform X2, partial [Silurus asotus]